jgi:hypothetical protein
MEAGCPADGYWAIGGLEQDGALALRNADTRSKADRMREEVRGDMDENLAEVRSGLRDRLTRR